MKILVTGCAGFIGSHVTAKLLNEGHEVIGIDNLNDYYDVRLKHDRLRMLGVTDPEDCTDFPEEVKNFTFFKKDILSVDLLLMMKWEQFDKVIHLAAQAGVRYSLEDPRAYMKANMDGFLNVLEGCRLGGKPDLLYASSSSVYGNNPEAPFHEGMGVGRPVSLYAATKVSNEAMAYAYSDLYDFTTTGMRFFTVYGPWGRPDMAYYSFADKIMKGEPITLYNDGELMRDFTYIDDVVESILRLTVLSPGYFKNGATPSEIVNIGRGNPEELRDFVTYLGMSLGKEPDIEKTGMQNGDVYQTWASIKKLHDLTGYQCIWSLEAGLHEFADWYKTYTK